MSYDKLWKVGVALFGLGILLLCVSCVVLLRYDPYQSNDYRSLTWVSLAAIGLFVVTPLGGVLMSVAAYRGRKKRS